MIELLRALPALVITAVSPYKASNGQRPVTRPTLCSQNSISASNHARTSSGGISLRFWFWGGVHGPVSIAPEGDVENSLCPASND